MYLDMVDTHTCFSIMKWWLTLLLITPHQLYHKQQPPHIVFQTHFPRNKERKDAINKNITNKPFKPNTIS